MKTGLVLEGGASRTLFSCGVIDALLKEKIHFDYIIGVSAGIAYGVGYASGQIGRNLTVSQKYMHDKRYMGLPHLINPKNRGYYNLDFVFREIPEKLVPFDFDAFSAYNGKIVAVLTELETGKAEYIEVPRNDHNFQILRASCALPVLFKPEQINGKLYMDGGISNSIPFNRAITEGCDKIITVLTRERGYIKKAEPTSWLSSFMFRKHPAFVEAMKSRPENYNRSRQELFRLEKEGKIYVIEPQNPIEMHRTESSPEKLTALYNVGLQTAENQMNKILGYLNS